MNEQIVFLEPSEFPAIDDLPLDPSVYDGVRFPVGDTTFFIFARKQNGIGVERLYKAVKLSWPK